MTDSNEEKIISAQSITTRDTNLDISRDINQRLTFNQSERLRHKTLVDALFAEGNRAVAYPLQLRWRLLDERQLKDSFRDHVPDRIGPLQVMFTVPKKKLRHAVDRVAMRRKIREAYRLHRLPLKHTVEAIPSGRTLGMAFIYMAQEHTEMKKIEAKMIKLLAQVEKDILTASEITSGSAENSKADTQSSDTQIQ